MTKESHYIRCSAEEKKTEHKADIFDGNIQLKKEIQDRSQIERALRESEERTRATFNAISDSVFLHPLLEEGFAPFVDVNDTACERYGYTRDEFLLLKAPDITRGVDADAHSARSHRRNLLEAGQLIFEATHMTKAGEEFPVEINSSVIELGGRPMILAVVRDITERKRAEESLRMSHERFLTVLDSIDATVYVADMETYEILFMNKNMVESFGRDMTGELCWEAFRNEPRPCRHCTNKQLVDSNGNPAGVCVWQGKNPLTGKWYNNYDRAIEWTDGRLVRLQIATDITQLKVMEQQLLQAQKMEAIGTLAGGIAHDFNNILMGIQGRASLMMLEMKPTDPNYEHIKGIEEYVKSASELTKQLLGFARGGKYEVIPSNINEIVDSSASVFVRTRKEVRLEKKFAEDVWTIDADRVQIEQVFLNLFVNAWQAMPSGGTLYLQTENVVAENEMVRPHQLKPGKYVKISVTDTGIGMDGATKSKIFDPFFTTKSKKRGTGLGLASAYGIIKNHNGAISVYSEVGHGTTFNIYLPASDKTVARAAEAKVEFVSGTGVILIVDDERMILDVGKPMLEQLGYTAYTAGSGKDAIEFFKNNKEMVDLVILDMIMPDMDGGEVFDQLKAIDMDVNVLLSSGYSVNERTSDILKRGCRGFIQKPFNIAEISKKIKKILG